MSVVDYETANGEVVRVEMSGPPPAPRSNLTMADDGLSVAAKAGKTFGEALSTIRPAVEAFTELITKLPTRPDGVELNFELKASAELGGAFIFAKAAGEGAFRLKLSWKPTEPTQK